MLPFKECGLVCITSFPCKFGRQPFSPSAKQFTIVLIPNSIDQPELFEKDMIDHFRVNTIGPIHLFNALMPLILRGQAKKVVAISSAMGDAEMASKFDLSSGPSYAMSKAALNLTVAKFSAVYRGKGVLCLSICPGSVATGNINIGTRISC